jgi:hypothetical protein
MPMNGREPLHRVGMRSKLVLVFFMSRSSRSQAIERRNLLFTKAIRLQVSLPAASRIDHDELVSGVAAPHQERASHFPYCEAPEGAQ